MNSNTNTNINEEQITISKKFYDELMDDQLKLIALQQSGVRNWDWYGEAMEAYRSMKEDTE